MLSMPQGKTTIAEAHCQKVFAGIGNWKRQFLEDGNADIEAGRSKPTSHEQQLEGEVTGLTQARGRGNGQDPGLEEEHEGPIGPFEDLEVIRFEAGMSISRFCALIDVPERTWRRW